MGAVIFFAKIEKWLQENAWSYEKKEKAGIIEINIKLQCDLCQCKVIVWVKEDCCIILGVLPERIRQEERSLVAEYLCRINLGLCYGHFDLDFDDGEIRYKTGIKQVDFLSLSQDKIGEFMISPAIMFDLYGPGLLDILKGEKSPEEAARI